MLHTFFKNSLYGHVSGGVFPVEAQVKASSLFSEYNCHLIDALFLNSLRNVILLYPVFVSSECFIMCETAPHMLCVWKRYCIVLSVKWLSVHGNFAHTTAC